MWDSLHPFDGSGSVPITHSNQAMPHYRLQLWIGHVQSRSSFQPLLEVVNLSIYNDNLPSGSHGVTHSDNIDSSVVRIHKNYDRSQPWQPEVVVTGAPSGNIHFAIALKGDMVLQKILHTRFIHFGAIGFLIPACIHTATMHIFECNGY